MKIRGVFMRKSKPAHSMWVRRYGWKFDAWDGVLRVGRRVGWKNAGRRWSVDRKMNGWGAFAEEEDFRGWREGNAEKAEEKWRSLRREWVMKVKEEMLMRDCTRSTLKYLNTVPICLWSYIAQYRLCVSTFLCCSYDKITYRFYLTRLSRS